MSKQITKAVKKEDEGLGYALQCIALQSVKCLHPTKELKPMWMNKKERLLYLSSIIFNPIGLYFLTHNKYFFMRINIKLYLMAGLLGYFVEKGTVLAFKENREKVAGKKESKKFGQDDRLKRKLEHVLEHYKLEPSFVSKSEDGFTFSYEYILKNANIDNVIKRTTDIESKLALDKGRLAIDFNRDKTIFSISKEKQEIFYLEQYIDDLEIPEGYHLPAVIGIDRKTGKTLVVDAARLYDVIIGGKKRSGKSCLYNSFLQSIMYLNKNVYFIMIDFKFIEFNQYKDLANVTFIKEKKKALKMVKELNKELERRQEIIEDSGVKNIEEYNLKSENKLPYIIFATDEASIYINAFGTDSNEVESLVSNLMYLGGAFGIFTYMSFQRATHESVSTNWRANFNGNICFNMRTKTETGFVLNDELIAPQAVNQRQGDFIFKEKDTHYMRSFFIDDDHNKVLENLLKMRKRNGVGKDD